MHVTAERTVEFKELLVNKTIVGGYVAHPAKLFVKYSKTDSKFVQHEDFSNHAVSFPHDELSNYVPLQFDDEDFWNGKVYWWTKEPTGNVNLITFCYALKH